MPNKPPHIVIFNPDQWRGDVLGHMGNPAAITPTLDRLVETDAVSFRHAFVQNPVCTPSRCCFMTGWYPHTRGHRTMFHMLQPDEPMLLRTLKENGYFVWWGGKNDVVPAQNGFDAYCDVKYAPPRNPDRPLWRNLHSWDEWRGAPDSDTYYSFYYGKIEKPDGATTQYDHDWAMIEGALDLIRQPPTDQPLCIYLPLGYPHPPYAVEDPWHSLINRDAIPNRLSAPDDWSGKPSLLKGIHQRQQMQGWSEERWLELRATYYGMIARVDHQLGLILDALRDNGLYDDTALFMFSDHGDYTGDFGIVEKTENTFEDCLTRVPFVIKPPKNVPVQPRVSDALVELTDFSATVEALAHIQPGHTHFGRSLLPVLAGTTDAHRDAVFSQGGRNAGEQQAMGLKSNSATPGPLYWPRVGLQQSLPEHSKATMCRTERYKYVHRLYESDELYDLESDPREQHNRIDDPALAQVRVELMARTMQFYLETGDNVPFKLDER